MTVVRIVIDERIRIREDDIPECVAEELISACTYDNPQYHKLKRMGFSAWKEKPVIKTWRVDDDGVLSFPRGKMQLIRDVLAAHMFEWKVADRREGGSAAACEWGMIPEMRRELWDHQREAVAAVLKRQNCLVRSPTGSGKTEVLLGAIVAARLPAIVVVHESGLLRQWQDRIELVLGMSENEVGLVRSQTFRLRRITLAMQQTLVRLHSDKWTELKRTFGFLGCEEVSKWAARTFMEVVDRFPAKYRVGISADETRRDRRQFLIYDMFGKVGIEIPKDKLVSEGKVLDVEVRLFPTEFEADWYKYSAEEGQVPDFNRLLDEMTVDDARNEIIANLAARCALEGKRVLVFSHRVEHCRVLDAAITARGVKSGLIAGDDAELCERTKVAIRSGDKMVGVGTLARIAMGVDIPSVEVGVVATPIHNNRQFIGQVIGRLCRVAEGKNNAVMYYAWDRFVSGRAALHNLRRWNNRVLVLDGEEWIFADDYEEYRYEEDDYAKEKRSWI